jgi:hypothetical protein
LFCHPIMFSIVNVSTFFIRFGEDEIVPYFALGF